MDRQIDRQIDITVLNPLISPKVRVARFYLIFVTVLWWWWWCRPHPVREHAQDLRPPLGARPASPHTSSSAATPTGSVHKSQTVSVVGMSGQLKRCNESWFGSLQSGQFAAGWLAGSILCR